MNLIVKSSCLKDDKLINLQEFINMNNDSQTQESQFIRNKDKADKHCLKCDCPNQHCFMHNSVSAKKQPESQCTNYDV